MSKKLTAVTMVVMMVFTGGASALANSGSNQSTFHATSWGHTGGKHFTKHQNKGSAATAHVKNDVTGAAMTVTSASGKQAHATTTASVATAHTHKADGTTLR